MITISRDHHITLLHKMGKKQSREKATKGIPRMLRTIGYTCATCALCHSKCEISHGTRKARVYPRRKRKASQPHLLNRSSLVMFLTCSLAPCSPSPVAASRTFSSELSSFFRQVRNIFGDTTKGTESKNNSFQWRMSLSKFPYHDIIKAQMMLAASKRSSVNNHCF